LRDHGKEGRVSRDEKKVKEAVWQRYVEIACRSE